MKVLERRLRQFAQHFNLEKSGTAYTCASFGHAHTRRRNVRVRQRSRRSIWRREEFAGKESEKWNIHGTQMWLSSLLFCPIVCCDARERSSYRVAVVFAVASGDQIVPSFFCPLPLRHPVSFCGSVTKTIWASGEGERARRASGRQRQGPFLPSSPRCYKTQLPQPWRRVCQVG